MSEPSVATLSGIELFADLQPESLRPIEQACRWRRYGAQEQIIDRHAESSDVFFVVQGRVRVVNYSVSGREVSFADFKEGGHFGELAAIDGEPRSASVMALTDCEIASLPADHFMRLLEGHPEVGYRVMMQLAKIVRASNDRIMDLSTLAANNRVHAELLRLAQTRGEDEREAVIDPIPVHSDIAARVSTTRETVARVMNELARKGIVERKKNVLVIRDIDVLRSMVEEVRGE